MPTAHLFNVVPRLPETLERLGELATNLQWSFDPELMQLFRRIDSELLEQTQHNPMLLLGRVRQERLDELAADDGFLHHLEQAWQSSQQYLTRATWHQERHGPVDDTRPGVAYFSAEFGLARCLPIYSGGLGILSGDHVKSCSDLGIPLVGIGLLYQKGYFHQYLNTDGWQQERYEANDFYNMPLTLERDGEGEPITIAVEYPGRQVFAQIWRVQVGRARIILLDTNISRNTKADQDIGDYLYGGDREDRIQQEMLLGIGGVRALAALGLEPIVYHMNEGHSAFMAIERIRRTMEAHGLTYSEARILCASSNVFTTHTAVPAGFDLFSEELMRQYIGPHVERLGIRFEELMALGRGNPADTSARFNMALLAGRNARYINGVSALHGEVTRGMFHTITPEIPVHEIPIGSITNGVHAPTWTAPEMAALFDRYLGRSWEEEPASEKAWRKIHEIPDAELWRTHENRRARLVSFARQRLHAQLTARGIVGADLDVAQEVLDPDTLTIGFARRFATYKRAALILEDRERLMRLLSHPSRPIQIVFAGKAHPLDEPGKRLIQEIVHFSEEPTVRRRMVFLEDYDIEVARYLVGGVDVWLNTPQRPMEASGTSGMKVVFNGGLNCSILDGWWAEGYDPMRGWAIGSGEEYEDPTYRNQVESQALYRVLESDILPLFYDRDVNGLPREWIKRMKHSIAELGPVYNTGRMLQEYHERYYRPATENYQRLTAEDFAQVRQQASWLDQVNRNWSNVAVEDVQLLDSPRDRPVGSWITVEARVRLGGLQKEMVTVEAYAGLVDENQGIPHGLPAPLVWQEELAAGVHRYRGNIECTTSGQHGFLCRIRPNLDDAPLFGTIRWE
jgi:starch phosphorylase